MKNKQLWETIQDQIDTALSKDRNITNIMINYKIKEPDTSTKNYLRMNIYNE